MNQIQELMALLCSKGVEFYELGEVISLHFGTRITKMKDSGTKFPVYGGGGESFRTNEFNRENEFVISRFAMSENCVRFVAGKFWLLDSGFTFSVVSADLNHKFIAYFLLNSQPAIFACTSTGAQRNLQTEKFKKFRIPVPPMEVQLEIVRILDAMTSLQAELQAELSARRSQYEFYRDQLLSFDAPGTPPVRWMTLGEVGEFTRGNGLQKSDLKDEGFPAIHYGQVHTFYGVSATQSKSFTSEALAAKLRCAEPGDIILATTSEDDAAVGKATAWLGSGKVAVSGDAYIYRHSLEPSFVSHFFASTVFQAQKKRHITGTKVRRISGDALSKIEIPVPPLELQQAIATTLNQFDELTTGISTGLPAEIEARRKQYEYYRDKLLTFEELAA